MSNFKQGRFSEMLDEADPIPARTEGSIMPIKQQFSGVMPDLTMEDVVMPRLRLAQALTPEVVQGQAKSGEWLLAGFAPVSEVEFIPMLFSKQRALRLPPDNQVTCSSVDGNTGVGVPGGDCAACPLSQWTRGEAENLPPKCDLTYSYIGYSITHERVALVEFRRTGVQAARLLNTYITSQGGLARFSVFFGAESRTAKRRSWHMPTVRLARGPNATGMREALRAAAQAMGGVPITAEYAEPEEL